MSKKILVIGATGRVGRELVKLLVGNGEAVRAATRNPAALASRFQNTLEVVEFDYERPQTFAPALNGVEKIFLSVRPGDNHSDQYAIPLIDGAKKSKIQLIVDLTAMGTEQQETFMLRVLEKYVESSGIPYTHLRPNWFMQNFDSGPLANDIRATSAIHLPAADALVSFVDVRDIAAVACAALTESRHIKKAYTLTGKEALSYYQVAEKLSHVSNRTISYVPITEEVARIGLAQGGVPADLIERWTDFYKKVRQGFCSPISTDIDSVLGRPPIAFDQYAMENSASWRSNA
jgi:uncharacterized protein YbjT (DUF2867 family)